MQWEKIDGNKARKGKYNILFSSAHVRTLHCFVMHSNFLFSSCLSHLDVVILSLSLNFNLIFMLFTIPICQLQRCQDFCSSLVLFFLLWPLSQSIIDFNRWRHQFISLQPLVVVSWLQVQEQHKQLNTINGSNSFAINNIRWDADKLAEDHTVH